MTESTQDTRLKLTRLVVNLDGWGLRLSELADPTGQLGINSALSIGSVRTRESHDRLATLGFAPESEFIGSCLSICGGVLRTNDRWLENS